MISQVRNEREARLLKPCVGNPTEAVSLLQYPRECGGQSWGHLMVQLYHSILRLGWGSAKALVS